jgi:hypothetical protein
MIITKFVILENSIKINLKLIYLTTFNPVLQLWISTSYSKISWKEFLYILFIQLLNISMKSKYKKLQYCETNYVNL